MMKRSAISLAAITLAASQSGSCGGGDSNHGTAVGASPAVVTCTEDPVGGDTGLTISRGMTVVPTSTGYTVTRFAECAPGSWHIYYLVTWALDGTTVHNDKDQTVTADRQVVSSDC